MSSFAVVVVVFFALPSSSTDDAGTDADLEPIGVVELLQRLGVHEEHGIAVGLNACLEAERGAAGFVVGDGLVISDQRAVAVQSSDPEAGLGDLGEDENGSRLRAKRLGSDHVRIQRCQRGMRVLAGLRLVGSGGRVRAEHQRAGQCGGYQRVA